MEATSSSGILLFFKYYLPAERFRGRISNPMDGHCLEWQLWNLSTPVTWKHTGAISVSMLQHVLIFIVKIQAKLFFPCFQTVVLVGFLVMVNFFSPFAAWKLGSFSVESGQMWRDHHLPSHCELGAVHRKHWLLHLPSLPFFLCMQHHFQHHHLFFWNA